MHRRSRKSTARTLALAGVAVGYLPQTAREGALMVIWTNPKVGQPEPKSGTFKTGRATGPLTMTRVDRNTVHFRFKGGTGTFDLGTLKYSFG